MESFSRKMAIIAIAFFGLGITSLRAADAITQGELQITEGDSTLQLPLEHTYVDANVSGYLARVTVTQHFTNPFTKPIEAVYVFPLPANSGVDRMTMLIGNRVIKGVIKERKEARETYEVAKSEGRTASLLEQERPNIFTQSVANILPGQDIYIQISYVQDLTYDHGTYEFVFPMVVGPRYIPGNPLDGAADLIKGENPTSSAMWSTKGWAPNTDRVPDASRITPPVLKPGFRSGHDISLRLSIDAGLPIKGIFSPSHNIKLVKQNESTVTLEIAQDDQIPNKDFVLRYDVAGEKPEFALLTHCTPKDDGYFMLMIQPQAKFKISEITPREMYFIIDRSGSMSGQPIEKVKQAMHLAIENMHPDDYFQIIWFSNTAERFSEAPVPNTPENVRQALAFVDHLDGSGGTEMLKGVNEALDYPRNPERRRFVFFMSDGFVGNESEIVAAVKEKVGDARVFTFGVGSSPNRFLIDKMAEFGHGYASYCRQDEDPQLKVRMFYDRIAMPYMMDINVNWGKLEVADVFPSTIPDLFAGQPVIIHGRYTKPGQDEITITGTVAGKKVTQKIPIVFPKEETAHDVVATLWARTKIEHLMDMMVAGEETATIKQVIAIALRYELMSAYTSFVAVEEKVSNPGKILETMQIPVPMPEGVSYQGVFGPSGEVTNHGSNPPPDSSVGMVTPKGSGSISGLIFDAKTSTPLPFAVVSLLIDDHQTGIATASGSDGRYTISNIPDGNYTVRISVMGYKTTHVNNVVISEGIIVDLGSIALNPGIGSITGRIIDVDNNKPVSKANIKVFSDYSPLHYSTQSTFDGKYKLSDIPAGVYSLEFSRWDYQTNKLEKVEIPSDIPCSIGDISLTSKPGFVKGRILDNSGQPLTDGRVTLSKDGRYTGFSTLTDRNGRFEIPNVKPGIYNLNFSKGRIEAKIEGIEVSAAKTSSVGNITALNLSGNVIGKVLDTNKTPIAGVQVSISAGPSDFSDANGTYKITDIPNGKYSLSFWKQGYQGLALNEISVSANKTTQIADVTLFAIKPKTSERGQPSGQTGATFGITGRVSGRVTDDATRQPLPGVNVIIHGTDIGTATEADGSFSLVNVPVGTYNVEFSMIGYQPVVVSGVSVSADKVTPVNAKLKTGSIQMGVVNVTAEKEIITKDPNLGKITTGNQIRNTAGVSNYNDVVALTAVNSGGLHIQGGRASEMVYVVDGINAHGPLSINAEAADTNFILTSFNNSDTVFYESPMILGELSPFAVIRAFESIKPMLKLSFLQYLHANPELKGRVAVGITVNRDGSIKEVYLKSSSLVSNGLVNLLLEQLRKIHFESSGGETVISVAWNFEIKS